MACTIACDQGHITAHKNILCNYSKYLDDILSEYPDAEHPIIVLTELNINDIKILILYMYTGELVINEDSSPSSLLRAAQILKIDSLTANDVDDVNRHDHDHDDDDDMEDDMDENDNIIINGINDDVVDDNDENDDNQNSDSNDASNDNNNLTNNINNLNSTSNTKYIPLQSQSSNNKIKCHLCNIGLSDVKCLYRHVLTRHLPEKWGYKCEFCDREFSRDDHLMRHYTTKHKNMEFDREKIRETRRLNREMAKNFHDQISTS